MNTLQRTDLLSQMQHAFERGHCVVLLGPRQCGKTTLAKQFTKALASVHFFDLEDPLDLAQLANPRLTLAPLTGWVVIDEIQRKPELFPLLRVLLDRDTAPAKFLLLGSAAPNLIRGASESLAGRVEFLEMSGFSCTEVAQTQQQQLWQRGGYPRAFLAHSDTASLVWRQQYIRTFFETDLRQLGINIAPVAIERAFAMLVHHHGQLFNGSELARSLGIAQTTARHYLDVLTGALVVRQLQPWFENLAKRQVRSPKFYIRDSGIAHALLGIGNFRDLQRHPKLGASFEGFVVEQLLMQVGGRGAYFWGTQAGAELDLLLFHNGQRIGVEIKHTDAPASTRSMHIAHADLHLDALWVIYPGERHFAINAFCTAMSLSHALAELDSG